VPDEAVARQAPRTVTLRRFGATVQVEPACAEVRRALRAAVHVPYQVPGGGLRVQRLGSGRVPRLGITEADLRRFSREVKAAIASRRPKRRAGPSLA
jgi:hypothetical protein